MKPCIPLLVVLCLLGNWADAQDNTRSNDLTHRYGLQVNLEEYPQLDPRQTIRSVIKATRLGNIQYMLAHLVSPQQVDTKLKGDLTLFRTLASKATPKKSEQMVNGLARQLDEGIWVISGDVALSCVDNLPALSLEKIGKRWFMHNRAVLPTLEK